MTGTAVRATVRRLVPVESRQWYAEARRRVRDVLRGERFDDERGGADWAVYAGVEQEVCEGPFQENKLANLHRAAGTIDGRVIRPGGKWSFWRCVGRPTASNGYLEGRTIVEGRLVRQIGGGLCQLSSLLHHLALAGRMEIDERHAHSLDIYHEDERYMPLGSDATVVWGSKDLRFRNPLEVAIAVRCHVDGTRLVGEMHSSQGLTAARVEFVRRQTGPANVFVETLVDGVVRASSEYLQRPGLDVR